ncbi:hypothetical protein X946_5507 [Burkholderia sp. ABCPW 111]|nr:hypothetical protein X946_5507 [Burkholderia sp. ABCPW 111]
MQEEGRTDAERRWTVRRKQGILAVLLRAATI